MKSFPVVTQVGAPDASSAAPARSGPAARVAFRDALGKALARGGTAPQTGEPAASTAAGTEGAEAEGSASTLPHVAAGRSAGRAAPHGAAPAEPRRGSVESSSGSDASDESGEDEHRAPPGARHAPHPVNAAPAAHPATTAHVAAAAPLADAARASTGAGLAHAARALAQDGATRLAGLQGKPALATPGPSKTARDSEATRERKPRDKETAPRPADATATREPPPTAPPADQRSAPTRAPEGARASAPALPPPPAGSAEPQGVVLRQAAHLRVDAGGLGALELHLRVRDGALHLRVDGEAAHAVEARAGELSRALAGEGLRLATVEAPPHDGARTDRDGGRGAGERHDAWQEARDARERPATAPAPPASRDRTAAARGVHVKA